MPSREDGSKAAVQALRDAQFAFIGTVVRRGANLPEFQAVDGCVVVRVDEVILAPPTVGDIKGRELTVRSSGEPAKLRERALFLATSWAYGAEIAVAEVARLGGRLDVGTLRTALLEERLRHLDEALLQRIAVAELVVAGTVAAIELLERRDETDDEDAARWRIAVVEVSATLKGRPPDDLRVPVLFPRPRTRRFHDAPTFAEGQEGIWLLQRAEAQESVRVKSDTAWFTALHPLDFQAPSLLPRVHVLRLVHETVDRLGGQ